MLDPEDSVRREAIGAAGRAKAAVCKDDLLDLLKGEVRLTEEAVDALGSLGDRSVLPKVMPFLTSKEVGRTALGVVQALGIPEDVPALLDSAREMGDESGRKLAVAVAAKLLGDRAVETLRKLLDDRRLRGSALSVLAERGGIACAPDAARYLSDSDAVAVRAAADLLGQARHVEAIPQLLPLLDDRAVRIQAAAALAKMPREKVAPLVLRYLGSRDPAVRGAAAMILNSTDADELVEKIRDVLGDSSPQVARYGVLAVRRRRLKDQAGEVEILSRGSEDRLRREALETLAELDWPGHRPKFLERLRKRGKGFLSEIAPLFAARKDDEPTPLVLDLATDEGETAYDALVALNAFRNPDAYARAAEPSHRHISSGFGGSLQQNARSLSNETKTSIRVEVPAPPVPRASFEEAFRKDTDMVIGVGGGWGGGGSSSWGGYYSLLDKIRSALGTEVVPVLEEDAVRIVTRDQAKTFWRAWVVERRTK